MNEQPINEPNVQQGSKIIWTIVTAVVITAIIVGAGVWWWQKASFEKQRQELQEQIDDLKGQISGVEEDELKDWKTYRNEEYGFEVMYPEDWEKFGGDTPMIDLVLKKEDKEQGLKNYYEDAKIYPSYGITINMGENTEYALLDLEKFAQNICTNQIIDYETIDNLDAVRCLLTGAPGGGYEVNFMKDNNLWSIRYGWIFSEEKDKFINIFDQILSTFKFIE